MKKVLLVLTTIMCALSSYSQLVNADELKKMKIQQYGQQSWKNTAKSIASSMKVGNGADKYAKLVGNRTKNQYYDGSAIHYVDIAEDLPRNKSELFEYLKQWATKTFNTNDCSIRLLDENTGCIIVQGAIKDVIDNIGGVHNYTVSFFPIIRIDIKDYRARITFSLSSYRVHREAKTGGLFSSNRHNEEDWSISSSFPFTTGYDDHEKSSAKALVMAHLCAKEYLRIIKATARNATNIQSYYDNW